MSTFGPDDHRPPPRPALVPAPAPGTAVPPSGPGPSPGERHGGPRAVPDLPPEPIDEREWETQVAREVKHQEVIDASFDRAEAYGRLGDFEHALDWLDRASTASGGLPTAYRAQRARWERGAGLRAWPARGA